MNKLIPIIIIAALAAGGAGFYAGSQYSKTGQTAGFGQANLQELRSLSPEERQARFQELGADTSQFRGAMAGNRGAGGFTAGEIIAKDEQSITIKLPDGGSRIVFYSESAEISKLASASPDALEPGQSVMVNGQANEDGTITAQTIQISRPGQLDF